MQAARTEENQVPKDILDSIGRGSVDDPPAPAPYKTDISQYKTEISQYKTDISQTDGTAPVERWVEIPLLPPSPQR